MQQENLSCQTIDAFLQRLSQLTTPEERITHSLSFMSHSLFRDKVPYFKGFWQAKEKALADLKETANALPLLWEQYKGLSEEFTRVKIVIDAEASFAAEQIELALTSFGPLVEKIMRGEDILPYSLKHFPGGGNRTHLELLQGSFLAINSLIAQLSDLRQEVLSSTMKVRLKNRLIADINCLIEKILPLRKDYKNQVTNAFLELVENFKSSHFNGQTGALLNMRTPIIQLQKEVKILQAMAQELSLTGDGFKKSRSILSPCWLHLKQAHENYKKKQSEQKAINEQKKREVLSKLDEFKLGVNASNKEEKKRLLTQHFKNMELSREEMTFAIDEVKRILEPFYAEEDALRQKTLSAQKSNSHARAEKLLKLQTLLDLEPSFSHLEEATNLFTTLRLTLVERIEIEPLLMCFSDHVSRLDVLEREERLQQERARKQKIRETLEELKRLGATFGGADFEQALLYNQAIQKHKERLQQTEQLIQVLEEADL